MRFVPKITFPLSKIYNFFLNYIFNTIVKNITVSPNTTKKTYSSRYHQKMIGNCKARTMNKLQQSDENHETDYKKCLAVL